MSSTRDSIIKMLNEEESETRALTLQVPESLMKDLDKAVEYLKKSGKNVQSNPNKKGKTPSRHNLGLIALQLVVNEVLAMEKEDSVEVKEPEKVKS